MTMVDRFLRLDARSLGLFRILMGLTLLGDFCHRWKWLQAFYSDEGVLPGHNHLFLVKDQGYVWSLYHSFRSVDENHVAFFVTFLIYVAFTLGWHTRLFHVLSVVCLVSLVGRNVLLDSPGNSVAITLLALSALLPCGKRLSLDSLRRSMARNDEHTPEELNDRDVELPKAPRTVAALVLVLMVGFIPLAAALQQIGDTWKDGSALYYALHSDRWTGALGVKIRESTGLLGAWTKVFRYAEFAVLPLALVPVARKYARAAAIVALLFVALTFVLLFNYGLYGWSLLAACALLVPAEFWDSAKEAPRPITFHYDVDCGICLWGARLFKRFDRRHNITFAANTGELPEGVTPELADETMLVTTADGKVYTHGRAAFRLFIAVPIGWVLLVAFFGLVVLLVLFDLGARAVLRAAKKGRGLYALIATNRHKISNAFGLGACGLPAKGSQARGKNQNPSDDPTPARKAWTTTNVVLSSVVSLLFGAALLAQTDANSELPFQTGISKPATPLACRTLTAASAASETTNPESHACDDPFTGASKWARVQANWGVWAPDPSRRNGVLVFDAETRGGEAIDVVSGEEPDVDLASPEHARQGPLWAAYAERIHQKQYDPYRKELRRYVTRGGDKVDIKVSDNYIVHLSAVWVEREIPAPGQPADAKIERKQLFNHRGSRTRRDSAIKNMPRMQR